VSERTPGPAPGPAFLRDREFMNTAIGEAGRAAAAGEVPVGAVVARDGLILGRAGNGPIGLGDPTAHAEVLALRAAAGAAGNYRLTGADLYVTLEPCLMCVGAALHARVARIVFGAADPKSGGLWALRAPWPGGAVPNHEIVVAGGVEADRSGAILRDFFAHRRREGPC